MNNQIQLVLKSSTTELPLNDKEYGIYLVPELDGLTGLPDIRTTSGVNSGYDGGWTSAQNYDARSITIRGVIANEDIATVERLRKQLTSLAGQGKSEELTLDLVTEAGNAYTLQVRTIALEMAMQRVLKQQEFMLQLRADDPLIYDSSETAHEALIQVSKATGGFLINFELPLAITGGSEEAVVTNDGLEQVPTITRMYGALHNPKIINHTTNQSMQIMADLGYSEGDWHTPSDPVEGKVIMLDDTPDNAPFADINLKGNTEQTTYTGKNLLEPYIDSTNPVTKNGITCTYDADEQTMTFNGTCTADNTTFRFAQNSINFTANVTKASVYYVSGSATTYCSARFYNSSYGGLTFRIESLSSSNPLISHTYGTSYTMSASNGSVRFNNGSVASNFKIKLMIADSEDTTYEPYTAGAAPNPNYRQDVRTVAGNNTVKLYGKNMFNPSGYNHSSSGLVNTLNADGTITTTGIPNTDYAKIIPALDITDILENGENYVTSRTSDDTVRVQVQATKISGGIDYYNGSFTVDKETYSKYVIVAQSTTIANWGSDPKTITSGYQLEKGSQATSFEPYREQRYELCLNGLGKNIYGTKTESGTIDAQYGTNSTNTYYIRSAGFIPVIPNTTYVLSATAGSTLQARAFFYDTDKTYISPSTGGFTNLPTSFTTTTKTKYMRIAIKYSSGATINVSDVSNIQLELGSSATIYTEHSPLELCKIGTYQDYIYKDGDKWYKHSAIGKYVYNNDLSTNGLNSTRVAMITPTLNIAPNLADDSGVFFSNMFMPTVINETGIKGTTSASKIRVQMATSFADSYDGFKALAAANNLTIYYPLATTTDTEITNEAVISQLNTMADQSRTYAEMTNVCTISSATNPQATTEVSYMTEKNPDNRDLIVIDSRLRTITLNGLDVYHLQADGSEFIMLAPGENRISLQSDITGDNGYAEVSYKQGYLSI